MLRLQDAQGLAHGSALDAELVGQLCLGGHALPGPQHSGPDPGAQFVGHLAVCPLWPLRPLPLSDGGVFRVHTQTLQLPAIFGQFGERWL
ncbi:hypothetical protein GCM10027072_58360 [Streptomyces bullii]